MRATTKGGVEFLRMTHGESPSSRSSVVELGRSLVARVLAYSPLPLLIRETAQRHRVTILVYHSPSEATMLEHLRFLRTRYTIISLRHFVESRQRHELRALPRKSLVITFDDGHGSNHALTDAFRRMQIPVTVFLCTGIAGTRRRFWFRHTPSAAKLTRVPDDERLRRLAADGFQADVEGAEPEALSRSEIEAMAAATFDFQSHTVTHPILPLCPPAKANQEISDSKRQLEEEYGFDVYALAYPNGDYSARECALARAAGYECALTVDLGFNSGKTDMFRLKRISIDDRDGSYELAVKVCGLWGALKRLIHRQPYGYIAASAQVSACGSQRD
jgi:peptidoglycan/xylan/chitin deacetylase (PgdA/CDA1 family)